MVSITVREAQEPGALDGYQVECQTCGMVWTLSVDPTVEALTHEAWHARTGR